MAVAYSEEGGAFMGTIRTMSGGILLAPPRAGEPREDDAGLVMQPDGQALSEHV